MNNSKLWYKLVIQNGRISDMNVKEWTGVHSSLEVSLHKINNMLDKQIIVGQLTE
jgi:hypothetical protein